LADNAGGECLRDIHRSDASLREHDCHISRGIRTRTVPSDPLPRCYCRIEGTDWPQKPKSSPIFHWDFCNSA
jgi:hypothetical protein